MFAFVLNSSESWQVLCLHCPTNSPSHAKLWAIPLAKLHRQYQEEHK